MYNDIFCKIEEYYNRLFKYYLNSRKGNDNYEEYFMFYNEYIKENKLILNNIDVLENKSIRPIFQTYFYVFKIAKDFFRKHLKEFDMDFNKIRKLAYSNHNLYKYFEEYRRNVYSSLMFYVCVKICHFLAKSILENEIPKTIALMNLKNPIKKESVILPVLKIIKFSILVDDYIIEVVCLRTLIEIIYFTVDEKNRRKIKKNETNEFVPHTTKCIENFRKDLLSDCGRVVGCPDYLREFAKDDELISEILNKEIHEMNYIKEIPDHKEINGEDFCSKIDANIFLREIPSLAIYLLHKYKYISDDSRDLLLKITPSWIEK